MIADVTTDPIAASGSMHADEVPAHRVRAQRTRIRALVALSYGVDTLLLAAFAAAGTIPAIAAAGYGAAGLASCALFYVLDRIGFSDRQRDPYLTLAGVWLNGTIIVATSYWIPEVGPLLLMLLFIVLAFGALRLSAREAGAALAVFAPAIALVLISAGPDFSLPMRSVMERALSAVWIVTILARCLLMGLYGARIREHLNQRRLELQRAHAEVHRLATRDDLTGLLNRRSIRLCVESEAAHSAGGPPALALALLDVDHFKAINDTYGHPIGDEVLRQFGLLIAREMRVSDRAGRFGGEEFLVLLRGVANDADAERAAERLRQALKSHAWASIAPGLAVTASVGVAVMRANESADQALARADRALYKAKHGGRDRVCIG